MRVVHGPNAGTLPKRKRRGVWFAPGQGQWYNSLATSFTKSREASPGRVSMPGVARWRSAEVNFANLPHDFAETLELVFVGITIVASLAIMVVFGRWWQR